MVDAVAVDGTHEDSEIGPETSPRSLGRLSAPLRAPLWLRLLAFAVLAFVFGLTINGVLFVFLLAVAAWCIHGGVRRRASDGKQRTTSRRVLVGVAVPLGLFVIMIPGIGLGDELHQSMDPAYAALEAERRALADEDRKRQEVQDQINQQAQASRNAEEARIQASEEAAAAQASEAAQAARTQASEEATAAASSPTPTPTPTATADSGSYGWANAFADAKEGCLAEAQSMNGVVTDADRQFCDNYAQSIADRYCTTDACSDPNDSPAESNDYVPEQNAGGGGTDCPPGTVPEVTEVDWENKIYAYICVPG